MSTSCDIAAEVKAGARRALLQACKGCTAPFAILVVAAIAIYLARMKWPVLALLLYTFLSTAVFMPAAFLVAMWFADPDGLKLRETGEHLTWLYLNGWPFWILCAVVVLCQLCLVAVPVRIVKERPRPRRSIWVTATAAAFLFAVVVAGIVLSGAAALFGDDCLEEPFAWSLLGVFLVSWLVWAVVFRQFARSSDPRSGVARAMRWLLRGTILELLVAVSSHMIVREKDVCCAHALSAAGIAAGLAVMLVSFGPALYFLYAERIRQKRPSAEPAPARAGVAHVPP